MNILGINSAYHESAAALLIDGQLACFVEEERINRRKHGKNADVETPQALPVGAIQSCLRQSGLTIDQVDLIGYSFAETGRQANVGVDPVFTPNSWGSPEGEATFDANMRLVPAELEKLGKKPLHDRFRWVPHHVAHAASAFLCSPFESALILAIDGIGEFDSLLMAHGRGTDMTPLLGLPYPHSLGFLWEKICQYLGFSEYDACKIMGLASYGDPELFREPFSRLARLGDGGRFAIDLELARFRALDYTGLEPLFGPPRRSTDPIEKRHENLAATLQAFTETALLHLCAEGRRLTGATKLCLSGGVALNCVANSRLEKEAGFEEMWVQPAANDAGTALGVTLALAAQQGLPRVEPLTHAYWGPAFSTAEIEAAVQRQGLTGTLLADPAETAAELIAAGNVVGWFQGRMEMGPRALGNRSLLADPRRHDMRDILNHKVKHREAFRPFAPSVLQEKAADWFDLPGKTAATDFMLFAYPVRADKLGSIPAVTHVDGTSRIQTVRRETNPRYHALISAFARRTGVPLVLNTSFNDSEPIVMTPDDALKTFRKTGIDAVILDNLLVTK
jgi:carbamoyltransferase